jgi:hypothetical protein
LGAVAGESVAPGLRIFLVKESGLDWKKRESSAADLPAGLDESESVFHQ